MQLLIFDLRGPLAHFRRPDTMGTQATYPFITRTALRGLAASILGLEALPEDPQCGIRLLAPVRTVAQELSMLGKGWIGGGPDFNRPTSVEIVVQPHYRVYYAGPLQDELSSRIRAGRSHYHTYLGSAYCLTFPEFVVDTEATALTPEPGSLLECVSVVPSSVVSALRPDPGHEYARVGGVLYEHIGERRFRGTVNLLYEAHGRPTRFVLSGGSSPYSCTFCRVETEGTVCLW